MQPKQPNKNKAKIEAVTLHVFFYISTYTPNKLYHTLYPSGRFTQPWTRKMLTKKHVPSPAFTIPQKKSPPQSGVLLVEKKLVWNGPFFVDCFVQPQVIGPIAFFSTRPKNPLQASTQVGLEEFQACKSCQVKPCVFGCQFDDEPNLYISLYGKWWFPASPFPSIQNWLFRVPGTQVTRHHFVQPIFHLACFEGDSSLTREWS